MKRKTQTVGKLSVDVSDGPLSDRLRKFLETPEAILAKSKLDPKKLKRLSSELTPEQIEQTVEEELHLRAVGQLIAKARKVKGLSHRQLAERVGVKHPRVVQVEQGENLEIATLFDYAQALEYDLEVRLVPKRGGEVLSARPGR
jgi:ribosome-binding protein aMBF1 (putative translation factor)